MSVDHSGHRERLKKAYRENGLMSFSPHEVIELMLYDALPRRDVNELAHTISDAFGGVCGLLNATEEELTEKCAVSFSTAHTLVSYMECVKAYREFTLRKSESVNNRAELEKLIGSLSRFSGASVALLSPGNEVVFQSELPKKDADRFIFSRILMYDAPGVILVYREKPVFTEEELREFTRRLELIGARLAYCAAVGE